MKPYNVCFLGFGNVGRALARLLALKSQELQEGYGIEWRITGLATRSRGWLARPDGFEVPAVIGQDSSADNPLRSTGIVEWLQLARPDVVFETTSLNHETGQPAIDYLTAALQAGCHVISANKGAVVHGYEELTRRAAAAGKRYFFESSVLDSAPVFSLFREALPAVKLRGFSGVFNSTSNVILETMEAGRCCEVGVKTARELGV
ncbi:MAG: homoserine dehydrogenase, partial [Pyrinomonadaceae bacterium]